MNPNERPNYQNSIRWNQSYSGWRKRQIIQQTLDDLHTQQMDMIDAAVEVSDLKDAKEILDWIRKK